MCDFCRKIAIADEQFERFRCEEKDFVFEDEGVDYGVYTNTGEPSCQRVLNYVVHCPACGRRWVV